MLEASKLKLFSSISTDYICDVKTERNVENTDSMFVLLHRSIKHHFFSFFQFVIFRSISDSTCSRSCTDRLKLKTVCTIYPDIHPTVIEMFQSDFTVAEELKPFSSFSVKGNHEEELFISVKLCLQFYKRTLMQRS